MQLILPSPQRKCFVWEWGHGWPYFFKAPAPGLDTAQHSFLKHLSHLVPSIQIALHAILEVKTSCKGAGAA